MKIGTTRVETFSDGVIAIIITIMVLSFKLPDINHKDSAFVVRQHLHNSLPYFIAYAFSFLMIGIYWINHHHMFHLLEKIDESLLIQNLLFLFWISLIPFCTVIIGVNPAVPDSVALYGAVLLLTTLSFAVMRAYALKKKLVYQHEQAEITNTIRKVSLKARTKTFIGALTYMLAIPLAYVNVYISYAIFLVPPIIFFIPDGIDNEQLAEKIGEKNT